MDSRNTPSGRQREDQVSDRNAPSEWYGPTGILADVAEQTDLSGIIYHLPRVRMRISIEAGRIFVDDQQVWPAD